MTEVVDTFFLLLLAAAAGFIFVGGGGPRSPVEREAIIAGLFGLLGLACLIVVARWAQ